MILKFAAGNGFQFPVICHYKINNLSMTVYFVVTEVSYMSQPEFERKSRLSAVQL